MGEQLFSVTGSQVIICILYIWWATLQHKTMEQRNCLAEAVDCLLSCHKTSCSWRPARHNQLGYLKVSRLERDYDLTSLSTDYGSLIYIKGSSEFSPRGVLFIVARFQILVNFYFFRVSVYSKRTGDDKALSLKQLCQFLSISVECTLLVSLKTKCSLLICINLLNPAWEQFP